jgi:hypothetical protein
MYLVLQYLDTKPIEITAIRAFRAETCINTLFCVLHRTRTGRPRLFISYAKIARLVSFVCSVASDMAY